LERPVEVEVEVEVVTKTEVVAQAGAESQFKVVATVFRIVGVLFLGLAVVDEGLDGEKVL